MNISSHYSYQRIICLTEETTETLYLLGEEDRIVGISGFTVRPKQARKTKPKISTYLDANIEQILDLQPDIVFAWSDLQAPICEKLIKNGIEVFCFNHRSIQGILRMMYTLGALVEKMDKAQEIINEIQLQLLHFKIIGEERNKKVGKKPKVYFEEWYDPLISGICWVSELIEICGGDDIYRQNREFPDAKRRIIPSFDDVIPLNPDLMIASWCGKMFKPERVQNRQGWDNISAIRNNLMLEIHSSIILQPGPAALTEGVEAISAILDKWSEVELKQNIMK